MTVLSNVGGFCVTNEKGAGLLRPLVRFGVLPSLTCPNPDRK